MHLERRSKNECNFASISAVAMVRLLSCEDGEEAAGGILSHSPALKCVRVIKYKQAAGSDYTVNYFAYYTEERLEMFLRASFAINNSVLDKNRAVLRLHSPIVLNKR